MAVQVMDYRNGDLSVQLTMGFMTDKDREEWGEWRWSLDAWDAVCEVAGYGRSAEPEPTRHVELRLTMFGFRLELVVCTALRPAREGKDVYRDRRGADGVLELL